MLKTQICVTRPQCVKKVPGLQILGYDNFRQLPDDLSDCSITLPHGVQLAPETALDLHIRLITCFCVAYEYYP